MIFVHDHGIIVLKQSLDAINFVRQREAAKQPLEFDVNTQPERESPKREYPEELSLSVSEFCRHWKIHPKTYSAWEKRGFAPRRLLLGQHKLRRIALRELSAWVAQLEADKARIRSPDLRHPDEPMSWLEPTEREVELARLGNALPAAVPARLKVSAALARRHSLNRLLEAAALRSIGPGVAADDSALNHLVAAAERRIRSAMKQAGLIGKHA